MLSEMESYEVTEWQLYFRLKNERQEREHKQAQAERRAKGGGR